MPKKKAKKKTKKKTEKKTKEGKSGPLDLSSSGPIQMGFWVPNRVWATAKFLVPLRDEMEKKRAKKQLKPLKPEVATFKQWVTTHSVYRMWLDFMIQQANAYIKSLDPKHKEEIEVDGDVLWIKDYDSLFEILNEIISTSPSFNNTVMVGTPMNALLAVCMATEAGVAMFHDATFNEHFKPVLDAWNTFLKSPKSLDKLDIDDPEKLGSWISKEAWKAGVWDQMQFDKKLPGYGFDSWNSFFIRLFEPGARPFKGDPLKVINIGCETTPWEYQDKIAFKTDFWIKDVNYSLLDIFGGKVRWAKLFEGGQVYQGFLSATHYHRWNSPLTGKLISSWVQPGTYFAQRPGQGEDEGTWEGTESQPYLGHVAARAIFIFQHETCGYVALICIGMVEVSTCVINADMLVGEDEKPIQVERGVEIGHFEFGGSTHMMIFQKNKVRLETWAIEAEKHQNDPHPTPMGSVIATVYSETKEKDTVEGSEGVESRRGKKGKRKKSETGAKQEKQGKKKRKKRGK